MAKNDYPTYVTPTGRFIYPRLEVASAYKGKGDKHYEAKLALLGQDAADFRQQLDDICQGVCAQKNYKSIENLSVKDTDDGEGIIVKFKVHELTKKKDGTFWDRKPTLYDWNGVAVEGPLNIGDGTIGRIRFQVHAWDTAIGTGITLQPLAVQIKKLVVYVSSDEGFGAGDPDGGEGFDSTAPRDF